jgi:methylaspartate mutase sigma subunit
LSEEKRMESKRDKKVLVIGVIGADVHAVGIKILHHAFTDAGFDVVNLGVMVSQEEFINAAIESDADAILISSLYGQGELDCRGMREKCEEAGLHDIPLIVGGNIVIGKQNFEDVKERFEEMGFDLVFPPGTPPEVDIEALNKLFDERDADLSPETIDDQDGKQDENKQEEEAI